MELSSWDWGKIIFNLKLNSRVTVPALSFPQYLGALILETVQVS